jgi:putative transposase
VDWASRAVLSWRLSNTMDVSFCLCALEDALARFGRPEIFNTDQGCQFTSAAFTDALIAAGIRISMDGAAAGWTTCSLSGCGAGSSTRTST